jgi:hypothetical protein
VKGRLIAAAWLTACMGACGGAAIRVAAIDQMEQVRDSAGAREGAGLAPEAFARGEQERDLARRSHQGGDDVAAGLHAERAIAAYGHALVVARSARATVDLAGAQKALDDATAQEQALEASRAKLEHDAEELERRVHSARERLLPASIGPASPEREAARGVAARSLTMQARLLCGAARLAAPDAAGLADADSDIHSLDERLAKSQRPAPIDDAVRVRARCLDFLTRARRGTSNVEAADALLAELSAAGGWDPGRDERGVGVTLHDAFRGAALAAPIDGKLRELGRVAAAHPAFALQVVVHAASGGGAASQTIDAVDAKRAEAAVQALAAGGATSSRIRSELAGTRAPIVDPSDVKSRGRNERLEVVFVAAGR